MDSSKSVLCGHVLSNLCLKLGTLTVDLFASRLSHQVTQYLEWKPDPYSIVTDAVSSPCRQGHCYAFPTFCLIPRALSQIQQDQVHTVTLITPCWQTKLWYPQMMETSNNETNSNTNFNHTFSRSKREFQSISVEQNSYVSNMVGFWEGLSLQRVSEEITQLIAKSRKQSTLGNCFWLD